MADISVSTSGSDITSNAPSVTTNSIEINTQYPYGNFNDPACKVRGSYFNWDGSCYNNEKTLYKRLLNGAFNDHGVKATYYPVDYNTSYDDIFGEDRDRTVQRKFPIQIWMETPPQDRLFGQFGIDEIDNFRGYVSKSHFESASKLNHIGNVSAGDIYSPYIPQVGDLIRTNYNSTLYEVIDVGEEEEMFLQTKHTWDFNLRVFRDDHISLSADTSATMGDVSGSIDNSDILDIASTIDSEKTDVLYTSASGEEAPDDPFAGW